MLLEDQTLISLGIDRRQKFVDFNPDFEVPDQRLATRLARLDDEDDSCPVWTG